MAKLFKNKLLKEKLQTFDFPDLEEKIAVLDKWANALQKNRQSLECLAQRRFRRFPRVSSGCPQDEPIHR